MDAYSSESSYVISNVKNDTVQLEIVNTVKTPFQKGHDHLKPEFGRSESETLDGGRNHSLGNKILISLPIGAFLIPSSCVILAYFYAVYKKTLKMPETRKVPYISDIGNSPPQNGLFTAGLVLSSYFTLGLVIVRFFQIKLFVKKVGYCINSLGLVFGIFIVIGKVLVASFQISEHFLTHFIGAGLYVLSSVAYVLVQSFIFVKDKSTGGKYRKILLNIRAFLSIGVIGGTLLFGIFILPPLMKYNREGYSMAQSGEWCFAVCKMIFMLTFVVEFWNLQPKLNLSFS